MAYENRRGEDRDYNTLAAGEAKTMREVGYLAGLAVSTSAGRREQPRYSWRRVQAFIHLRWGF